MNTSLNTASTAIPELHEWFMANPSKSLRECAELIEGKAEGELTLEFLLAVLWGISETDTNKATEKGQEYIGIVLNEVIARYSATIPALKNEWRSLSTSGLWIDQQGVAAYLWRIISDLLSLSTAIEL